MACVVRFGDRTSYRYLCLKKTCSLVLMSSKKHVLLFSCLQKNMFSCSHVLKKTCSLVLMSSKKHVILFSCLKKNMFSCPHVFKKKHVILFSCLKNKNMLSCSHVFKKHVLLSNRGLAWYGSETVPPTILVI